MTESTNLQARYGTNRSRDRVIAFSIAGGLVALFALWAGWVNATDRSAGIEWVAYESTTGGTSSNITWHLTAPIGTAVTCGIRTVGNDMSTNGWKVVELDPASTSTTTHAVAVRSVGNAKGIEVYACWRTGS
ncbi:MAG: hypothetical protein RLZ72_673 [Actinomycetota bacterium]|jgi:hypothetical protein